MFDNVLFYASFERIISGNMAVYKIKLLALLLRYQDLINSPRVLCLSQLLFAVYVQFHHTPAEKFIINYIYMNPCELAAELMINYAAGI